MCVWVGGEEVAVKGRGTRKSIIICKLAIDRHYGIMVSRSSILSQLLELSLIYVYVQVLLRDSNLSLFSVERI